MEATCVVATPTENSKKVKIAEPLENNKMGQIICDLLCSSCGTYEVEAKFYSHGEANGGGKAKANRKTILDGKFVQEEFSMDMGANIFQGVNIFGFDKDNQKILSLWIDNSSSNFFNANGEFVKDSKTEFELFTIAPYKDHLTQKLKTSRQTYEILDGGDKIISKHFDTILEGDNKEFVSMEFVYLRTSKKD